jgi:hypothetical protein
MKYHYFTCTSFHCLGEIPPETPISPIIITPYLTTTCRYLFGYEIARPSTSPLANTSIHCLPSVAPFADHKPPSRTDSTLAIVMEPDNVNRPNFLQLHHLETLTHPPRLCCVAINLTSCSHHWLRASMFATKLPLSPHTIYTIEFDHTTLLKPTCFH